MHLALLIVWQLAVTLTYSWLYRFPALQIVYNLQLALLIDVQLTAGFADRYFAPGLLIDLQRELY